ncbi:Skp1 domain containing protein [Pyrenophora tritici-repentis]|nr:Skp1 domain containing protein [Pyrenophora tritici-repentis]
MEDVQLNGRSLVITSIRQHQESPSFSIIYQRGYHEEGARVVRTPPQRKIEGRGGVETTLGLIKNLKIPSPTTTPPPTDKDILFHAYLIHLVPSEMWNNGSGKESERFLAALWSYRH